MTKTVTVDDVLERVKVIMSDPDRVVLDPMNLYESSDGVDLTSVSNLPKAARVCFYGAFRLATHELVGGNAYSDENNNMFWSALNIVRPFMVDRDETATLKLLGAEGCITAIEEAQAFAKHGARASND